LWTHADRVYDLPCSFNCTTVSLDDCQKIVLKGPIGKRNSLLQKPKPFTVLQKPELELELAEKGIYDGKTKKEMQKLLEEDLHGVS